MTFDPGKLSNTYFVMRHGHSEANAQKIISSDPETGTSSHGLTEAGKREVGESARIAKAEGVLDSSAVVVSSDFVRAKETAAIVADILVAKEVMFTPKLRERFFGRWEATDNSNYEKVWEGDVLSGAATDNEVESTSDVLQRAVSLIEELEEKYSSRNILLVSHGDTLQILQTAFNNVHPSQHRSLHHLETAEIRSLK